MKLRNKETGEIAEIKLKLNESLPDGIRRTIEEAGWEETREPLIKDEKIRKAVRVWAEAIGAKNIVFDGSKKVYSFYYENNKGVEKLFIYGDNDLEELKRYTITELCGEEAECES